MSSTRLPGKVLLPIGPYPAIIHTLKRCEMAGYPVVLAVPNTDDNLPLTAEAAVNGFRVAMRHGAEDDVLGRYLWCAREEQADIVVRVTGDCPFVQPEMIQRVAKALRDPAVYATNAYGGPGGTERTCARGWDVEAFRVDALASFAEHVTACFRMDENVACDSVSISTPDIPVALDTPEDYAWFQRVAELTSVEPPHPTPEELVALINQYPELKR